MYNKTELFDIYNANILHIIIPNHPTNLILALILRVPKGFKPKHGLVMVMVIRPGNLMLIFYCLF